MQMQCDHYCWSHGSPPPHPTPLAVPLPGTEGVGGERCPNVTIYLYLGETVHFLRVLRRRVWRLGGHGLGIPRSLDRVGELATALAVLASVSARGGLPGGKGVCVGGVLFRGCSPLLPHAPGLATSWGATTLPVEERMYPQMRYAPTHPVHWIDCPQRLPRPRL
uniref:Uncharacterized protein n=1 Tax=Mus spicilegus TaxID=10103 RepID=A0A8C6GE46_MUSSI